MSYSHAIMWTQMCYFGVFEGMIFTLASSLPLTGKPISGDFNVPEITWFPVKAQKTL